MRILSRYLLRLHIPPFLFALTGLTLLLLLDQVSRRFGRLVGKGLEGTVIAEVFLYSVPFILAQTFPMAVLIAVLYVFTRLAGDNEITAMKASGIPLVRLLVPLVVAAAVLASGMTLFNNTVLPESNHRLQVLLTSIAKKKPTFQLREQAVNEVLPARLYVQVARIDRARSALGDVVLYDEREPNRSRTIYADSGRMAYNPDQTDLFLVLHDGTMQERMDDRKEAFQRVHFDRMVMKVAGVSNELERGELGGWRGDREMTIPQMREEVRKGQARARAAQRGSRAYAVALTEALALGDGVIADEPETAAGAAGAEAPDTASRPPGAGTDGGSAPQGEGVAAGEDGVAAGEVPVPGDTGEAAAAGNTGEAASGADTVVDVDEEVRRAVQEATRLRAPREVERRFETYASQITSGERTVSQFQVEIHKKYTIPAACLVFVLIGAPIAVRYPEGGMALVVGASLAFFCAYYVALVGGEELADEGILSAFWAMWAPNILFGTIGVVAVWRVTRAGR